MSTGAFLGVTPFARPLKMRLVSADSKPRAVFGLGRQQANNRCGTERTLTYLVDGLLAFSFYYPLFMACLWMIGGLYYFVHWEVRAERSHHEPPPLPLYPPVSVLVPCYNEGSHVEETITALFELEYPDFEVIAINDGSSDDTGPRLQALASRFDRLRIVHHARNQGKAIALRSGAMVARSEFLVCIDGDALLDRHAATWMMHHFLTGARVGAVTGNPRVRTRSTLLGKIQVGEFSSIIGLIKRSHRVYGRIFTASGVVTAFRKRALHNIGYWSADMVTEDIDISWKLQLDHWDIRFEPNALCWILMPETLRGLWRQRLRWAQGGAEVLLKYFSNLLSWRKRRMWMVYLELVLSILWAYVIVAVVLLWLVGSVADLPEPWKIERLIPPGWSGVLLGLVCFLQFAVSIAIDSRYEPRLGRYYYWVIWYPLVFWMINACTAVVALPRALLKRKGTRARWVSPDRGIKPSQGVL